MIAVHLLTGDTRPGGGGVGDYTRLLAAELLARGTAARIWDTRDPDLRTALPAALREEPGYVLLQYVPNTLGARGANLGFCLWLRSLSRAGADVRVMFHEPYFYFSWNPLLNGLAIVQRMMAAVLLRAASQSYVSTAQWLPYLEPYAPREAIFTVLPIPSTIPSPADETTTMEWRQRLGGGRWLLVGHFGTYGDHVARELEPMIPAALRQFEGVRFVCIGRNSERFVERVRPQLPDNATRIIATGELSPPDTAAAIAACDVMVQPYPDGVTTRRTSVMAPLALGIATVTSRGFLTEPIWQEAGAVALAPASDADAHADAAAALLRDAGARGELASRGRAVYEAQFSIQRTVDALLR
jgi:hypothetical protein